MSIYEQVHIEQSFTDMYIDKKLDLRVKVWFMVFVVNQKYHELQQLFRLPNVKSDMAKFLERHNINDINNVPPCKCSCGNFVAGDVNRVLRKCRDCKNNANAVVHSEKVKAWNTFAESRDGGQTGKCFCCGTEIHRKNFSAAHVIASYYGGLGIERNLRPTCKSCNKAMMTTDLYVFKAELVAIGNWLRADQKNRSALMEARWQELAHIWFRPNSGR